MASNNLVCDYKVLNISLQFSSMFVKTSIINFNVETSNWDTLDVYYWLIYENSFFIDALISGRLKKN